MQNLTKILKFESLREISLQSDRDKKRRIILCQADIKSLKDFTDDQNVRRFLSTNSKEEKVIRQNTVHSQIFSTLENEPENFNILNGGITILCKRGEINNDLKQLSLLEPSIINGTQTKGVIELFLERYPNENVICKVEVLCIDWDEKYNQVLRDEITISRNQQNNVKNISIAGKRGVFDKLNQVVDVELKKDESQKNTFDTLKLIQLLFLIMPNKLWLDFFNEIPNRSSIYSGKGKWLKRFEQVYSEKEGKHKDTYNFFISIAQKVLNIYLDLKNTTLLEGTGKQIKEGFTTNKNGTYNLKDGWAFPIISALSHYVEKNHLKYEINIPKDKEELRGILAMIYKYGQYEENKNVQLLGKNRSSYDIPIEMLELNKDLKSYSKQVFR